MQGGGADENVTIHCLDGPTAQCGHGYIVHAFNLPCKCLSFPHLKNVFSSVTLIALEKFQLNEMGFIASAASLDNLRTRVAL